MNTNNTAAVHSKVIIKLGSSTLTCAGNPNHTLIARLCEDLNALRTMGLHPVLVTSGAVQLGRCDIQPNSDAAITRACRAAIGQIRLVAAFSEHLSKLGYCAAQMLLSREEFRSPLASAGIAAAIDAICCSKGIPLINENDVTSSDGGFPSNDELSAEVAVVLGARKLIILTDRSGVYEVDPRLDSQARLFETISAFDERLLAAASEVPGVMGTGGMKSKIKAAQMAAARGTITVVTCYDEALKLSKIAQDTRLGTWIMPVDDARSLQSQLLNHEEESPA
ncbi:hypothetical protein WKW80_25530 [Variovorax humicola]|uniref:Aspartate/glutamate/uridylate kinase domain-containing protein n=1 Tax=Variovorax humicola TaxID=1769758 RepID=A0ABU8W5J6_9BURK